MISTSILKLVRSLENYENKCANDKNFYFQRNVRLLISCDAIFWLRPNRSMYVQIPLWIDFVFEF